MSEERQIKFKYVFPENYNPVYCNGALGGISTRGEIVANFFGTYAYSEFNDELSQS